MVSGKTVSSSFIASTPVSSVSSKIGTSGNPKKPGQCLASLPEILNSHHRPGTGKLVGPRFCFPDIASYPHAPTLIPDEKPLA
jgi:hypothetical protein